jgi:hypothetical protein
MFVAVDEFYSSGYLSESIAEARSKGVFVSQPSLKSNLIHGEGYEYRIQDVWIERATRAKYRWFFFRHTVPIGYRLMLQIGTTDKPGPKKPDLWRSPDFTVVCNNSIEVGTFTGSRLLYTNISPPLPSSLQCIVKKRD